MHLAAEVKIRAMGHALTCLQPRNKLDDQEDEIEVTHDVYTKTIRECPAESNEIPPAGVRFLSHSFSCSQLFDSSLLLLPLSSLNP